MYVPNIGILGDSCADIYNKNPTSHGRSGYNVLKIDHLFFAYCDMELDCGGIKGNWIRIVRSDTRRGNTCPSGWNSHKLCCTGSSATDCYSAHFSLNSRSYSKVCGRYYETRKEVWMVYFQLHMHMEKLEVTNQKIITMISY